MPDTVAKLTIGDQTYEFPVLSGSVGPQVIDIRSLYAKTGMFTYDPGYTSTAACDSTITYIDGDKGELMYRGYPIDQLAEKSNYLEVCYLLLYGELPTADHVHSFMQHGYAVDAPDVTLAQQLVDIAATAADSGVVSSPVGLAVRDWLRSKQEPGR